MVQRNRVWAYTILNIWRQNGSKKWNLTHLFLSRNNENEDMTLFVFRQQNLVADWNHPYDSCTVGTCVSKWRALRQHHFRQLSYFWSCQNHRNPSFASFLVRRVFYLLNLLPKQLDVHPLQCCYFRRHLVWTVMMTVCFYLSRMILIWNIQFPYFIIIPLYFIENYVHGSDKWVWRNAIEESNHVKRYSEFTGFGLNIVQHLN